MATKELQAKAKSDFGDATSNAISSSFTTNDREDEMSDECSLQFDCGAVDVSKSNLSFKARTFMFHSDEHAMRAKNPAALFPRTNEKLSVSFEEVVELINLDLLDEEGREAEEACKFYLKTDLHISTFIENMEDYDLRFLHNKVDATEYWNEHEDPTHKTSVLTEVKKSSFAEFKELLKTIESNWEQGGCADEAEAGSPVTLCFPDGDREFVEEINRGLMDLLLGIVKPSGGSINIDGLSQLFTSFASLSFLLKAMEDMNLQARVNQVFTHKFIDPEDVNFLTNWEQAREGIIALLSLFEREVMTIEKVEVEEFADLKGLDLKAIQRLRQRVLVKLESFDYDSEEEAIHLSNSKFSSQNNKSETLDYKCLISKTEFTLIKKQVEKKLNGSIVALDTYYDADSLKKIKTPLVVPATWQDVDIVAFLRNPLFTWHQLKFLFLKQYYQLLNLGMTLAMMNGHVQLLTLLRNWKIPEAFKPHVMTNCRFADNSKSGLVPLLVYKKEEHPKKKKRYLEISSSTFFLNPLVRADLFASYVEHCSSSQSCSGHSGMLLVRMIRMQRYDMAKLLIQNGVKINSKCCLGDVKSLKWISEDEQNVPALPAYIREPGASKNFIKESTDFKVLQNITGVKRNSGEDMNVTKRLRSYAEDCGVLDDHRSKESARRVKICPLSAAVDVALETGDNKLVEFMLENDAQVWRADCVAFFAVIKVLKKISLALKDDHFDAKSSMATRSLASSSRMPSLSRIRLSGNFLSSISTRSLTGSIGRTSFDGGSSSVNKMIDTPLAGLKLPRKIKNLIRITSDAKFGSNFELMIKIVEKAAAELKSQMSSGKTMNAKEVAAIDTKVKVGLRTSWLHYCLMHEEWDVVRLLIKPDLRKKKVRQYSLLSKSSTVPNAFLKFDWLTCYTINKTVDILLLDLSKSNIPNTAAIINSLYFLLKEFDIMFSWQQCKFLFQILVHGVLNVPSPRGGVAAALTKLLETKQMKHALGIRLTNDCTLYSLGDSHWNADAHQKEQQWILKTRQELCIQLFANSMQKAATGVITQEFFEDSMWMISTVKMVTLGNYAASVVPYVFALARNSPLDMDEVLNDILYDSLRHEGLTNVMLHHVQDCLTPKNAALFIHIQLTFYSYTPDFEDEVAGDFSMLTTLMKTIDMVENNEGLKEHKSEIYAELLDLLRGSDTLWADGLGYVVDHASLDKDHDFVPILHQFVEAKRTNHFSFCKETMSLTLMEQDFEEEDDQDVYDCGESEETVEHGDEMKDVTMSDFV